MLLRHARHLTPPQTTHASRARTPHAARAYAHAINTNAVPDFQRPPGGYNITVYHTLHAEVDVHRTHHWTCGTCGNMVKRANNRWATAPLAHISRQLAVSVVSCRPT
jgi:hypothetical protein